MDLQLIDIEVGVVERIFKAVLKYTELLDQFPIGNCISTFYVRTVCMLKMGRCVGNSLTYHTILRTGRILSKNHPWFNLTLRYEPWFHLSFERLGAVPVIEVDTENRRTSRTQLTIPRSSASF